MSDQRRQMRLVHFWPGLDVTFQVVGVQFHQSGCDQITGAIDGASRNSVAFPDLDNLTVGNGDGPREDLICQHQPRIGKLQVT